MLTQNYRTTDPPTSVRASIEMENSGSAARQRTACLDAVAATPGLTAREIEARIGIKAHKRLPELREAGLVRNGPSRLCTVSGKRALTWDPDGYSFAAREPYHTTTHHGAVACH